MSELLGVGTHRVTAFDERGQALVRKEPALAEEHLSPFWRMMRTVFGWSFAAMREAAPTVCSLLGENPYCAVPRFVRREGTSLVFTRLEGSPWGPDRFPESPAISRQLGQFLAWNHSHSASAWGIPGQQCRSPGADILPVLEEGLGRWNGPGPLHRRVRQLIRAALSAPLPEMETGLMMADLSANQFVFAGDRLGGCVDLDAVVFGPTAWDLALARHCVSHWDAFRDGYETLRPLPREAPARRLCRFLLALQDESPDREEMRAFLEDDDGPATV